MDDRVQAKLAKFEAKYPGLILFLANSVEWSSLASRLLRSLGEHGELTLLQTARALRLRDKTLNTRRKRS